MNSETLKNKLKPIVYPIINFIPRRRLKNKKFTIICDNCWAGKVYQELGCLSFRLITSRCSRI